MMTLFYHIHDKPAFGSHRIEVESVAHASSPNGSFLVLSIGEVTIFCTESQLLDVKIAIDNFISRSVENDAILNPAEVLALKAA